MRDCISSTKVKVYSVILIGAVQPVTGFSMDLKLLEVMIDLRVKYLNVSVEKSGSHPLTT